MDLVDTPSFKYKKERFFESFSFFCRGCNVWHSVENKLSATLIPTYRWNGNSDRLTIIPSIKISKDGNVCNVRIADGYIYYFPNTTHHLKSQTLKL